MNYTKQSNNKKQKTNKSKTKKIKSKISIVIFKIILVTIIIGLFALGGAGLGAVTGIIKNAPPIDDVLISLKPQGFSTFIYDQDGNEITQLHVAEANRVMVELDQIPQYLQDAVVAIEDERYYSHKGVDIKGFLRAIVVNLKSMSFDEGASTITQQLIKNNVLTSEKKIKRKLQEQYLAIEVEKNLKKSYGAKKAKEIILENYLNTVALGSGTNGVQSASKRYFNKDVSDLTLAESAVIAGITQLPTYYNPILNPDNNKEKQLIILRKMLEQEYITETEYNTASKEDVYSNIQKVAQEASYNSHYTYFIDEVIDRVKKDLQTQLAISEPQAFNLLYRGGLSIYTTQDLKIQNIMDESFKNDDNFIPKNVDYEIKLIYKLSVKHKDGQEEHFSQEKYFPNEDDADKFIDDYKKSILVDGTKLLLENKSIIPQPQASMVLLDYHNGYVKAIQGGRGDKTGSKTFNRATNAPRQPGSTFKILAAYAPALDTGKYTAGTIIDDVPITFKIPGQKSYTPHNWYETRSHKFWWRGLSTIREGIRDSMNILAVKTTADVGVDTTFNYLKNFGFTTLADNEERNGRIYTDKTLSLPLGGLTDGVTNLELTAAYGTIANNGTYVEPKFFTKVLDHDGNILIDNSAKKETTVIKESTAFILTDMMKDVVTSGTGTRARFKKVNMPIAAKTGTTSDDFDLQFSGYTPYYAASVWFGHDQPKSMKYNYTSYHAILWRDVMEQVHEELPYKDFDKPNNVKRVNICTVSGKLAVDGLCNLDPRGSTIKSEYFVAGTEPTESCDVHVKEVICKDSGLFATEFCPEDSLEEKIFIIRTNPLPIEDMKENVLKKIEDYELELPPSMIGEYCNVHGPNNTLDPNGDNPFDPFDPNNNNPFDPFAPINGDDNSLEDNDSIISPPSKEQRKKKDDFNFRQY